MIKSFRGQIADGGQQRILLRTNTGETGYNIKKFKLFPVKPGGTNHVESVAQIWSVEQDPNDIPTTNPDVNFNSPTLLAVSYFVDEVNMASGPLEQVIFDKVTVNQDIFITHTEVNGSQATNYYIELEQVKLDLNEATVATLKDMRGRE